MSATSATPGPRRGVSAAGVYGAASLAALLFAFVTAWRRQWVSDDAFITFRYAEHLVQGLGLVFNPGERVEGYSNFLWTLGTALGLRLGVAAERWTVVAGIACYLSALGALAWNAWTVRREAPGVAPWIPIAAGLGALHTEWNHFATGGLETSLIALEVTLLYVVLARSPVTAGRAVAAGLLLGLLSLTRPDGPIFAGGATLYVLIAERGRRLRTLAALLATFLALWIPYTLWRVGYYGDFFANTYYAKSGGVAWWSQGAFYVGLYFMRYWPLLLGAAAILFVRRPDDAWKRRVLLAAALALPYIAFVARVGGDFMFGRFLIPVTPLLLVLLELAVARVAAGRARTQWLVAGAAAAAILFTPYPLPRDPYTQRRGIVREPYFYTRSHAERVRRQGLELRRYLEGLPVRMAFYGGEAMLVYYARPRIAIECVTGLTDHTIARQPLEKRGRVGHEKLAPADYVLTERRVHLTFFRNAPDILRLDREIPRVTIEVAGLQGRVLTWESAVIDSLRARGAVIQDFPRELDEILKEPSMIFRWVGWLDPDKMRRFYFDQSPDSLREALLLQRIREASGT